MDIMRCHCGKWSDIPKFDFLRFGIKYECGEFMFLDILRNDKENNKVNGIITRLERKNNG